MNKTLNKTWKDHLGFPQTQGRYGFLLVLLIDALGAGLFLPLSMVYFQVTVNFPLPTIGLVLTIATVCALPVSLLTGNLVDRIGARSLTAISQIIQAIGFAGYIFAHNIPVFFVMALLLSIGSRIFFAASASLIVDVATPHELDRWFGLVGVIRNVGLGMGSFLAGFVLATRNPEIYHLLSACCAFCYLVAGCLLLRFSEPGQKRREQVINAPFGGFVGNRLFLGFLLCNIACILCMSMLSTAFPVYVTEALHAPGWVPGSALMLNSVLVIGCQTFIIRLLEPFRRTRAIGAATLVWGTSCSLLALVLVIPYFLLVPSLFLVMTIHTLASLLYGPTVSALIADLAPEALRGRYLAAYEFAWGVASAVTPALFSFLYVVTPMLPWIFLAGLVSTSGLGILWLERRLPMRAVRRSKR